MGTEETKGLSAASLPSATASGPTILKSQHKKWQCSLHLQEPPFPLFCIENYLSFQA